MSEHYLLRESGAEMIAAERERQVTGESWGHAHDDQHVDGELNFAAQAYCQSALEPGLWPCEDAPCPPMWPWPASDYKPSDDSIRDLVKAGALIAAEIDRLKRAKARWEAL